VNARLRDALDRAERELVQAEQRARELIVFCDGLEEAGQLVYAQRGRVVADDLLRISEQLRRERSARASIQIARDGLLTQLAPGAAA
jgi:hypothetical protein